MSRFECTNLIHKGVFPEERNNSVQRVTNSLAQGRWKEFWGKSGRNWFKKSSVLRRMNSGRHLLKRILGCVSLSCHRSERLWTVLYSLQGTVVWSDISGNVHGEYSRVSTRRFPSSSFTRNGKFLFVMRCPLCLRCKNKMFLH